mmetsp:Transcript_17055/g.36788  ORF Transcript_17055/g.36788 Transcript_17055/m.36788 type:complete len:339 (-) Transcript_17055:1983-2999(-)
MASSMPHHQQRAMDPRKRWNNTHHQEGDDAEDGELTRSGYPQQQQSSQAQQEQQSSSSQHNHGHPKFRHRFQPPPMHAPPPPVVSMPPPTAVSAAASCAIAGLPQQQSMPQDFQERFKPPPQYPPPPPHPSQQQQQSHQSQRQPPQSNADWNSNEYSPRTNDIVSCEYFMPLSSSGGYAADPRLDTPTQSQHEQQPPTMPASLQSHDSNGSLKNRWKQAAATQQRDEMTSSSSSSSIIHTICRHVDSKKDILTMQDSSHTNRPGVKTALMVVKKCQVKRARYCHPLAFVPTKVEKVNLAITACMEWTALIAIMEFGAVELEESAVEEQGTPILRRHGG